MSAGHCLKNLAQDEEHKSCYVQVPGEKYDCWTLVCSLQEGRNSKGTIFMLEWGANAENRTNLQVLQRYSLGAGSFGRLDGDCSKSIWAWLRPRLPMRAIPAGSGIQPHLFF